MSESLIQEVLKVPFQERYKTDKNGVRWVMLGEAYNQLQQRGESEKEDLILGNSMKALRIEELEKRINAIVATLAEFEEVARTGYEELAADLYFTKLLASIQAAAEFMESDDANTTLR